MKATRSRRDSKRCCSVTAWKAIVLIRVRALLLDEGLQPLRDQHAASKRVGGTERMDCAVPTILDKRKPNAAGEVDDIAGSR